MRTRVRTDTLYEFDELSEEAQSNVIEYFGSMNLEHYDPDRLTEQFADRLLEWGFPVDKIEWSLNHSQGDGVAFYGTIDVPAYLRKTKQIARFATLMRNQNIDVGAWLSRNSFGHHYSHWNTMTVESEVDHDWKELSPTQEKLATLLQEGLEEHVVEVSRELEKLGYAEWDYVSSREYIVEQIEANEYEFTENGGLVTC